MPCIFCLHLPLQIHLSSYKVIYGPVIERFISLRALSSIYVSNWGFELGAQQALLLFEPPPQAHTIVLCYIMIAYYRMYSCSNHSHGTENLREQVSHVLML